MATVGQLLLNPEKGWKRINSDQTIFVRTGTWKRWDETQVAGSTVSFSFYGTKLRIIGSRVWDATSSADLYIDGEKVYTINESAAGSTGGTLEYENTTLADQLHTAKVINNAISGNGWLYFNAIDVTDVIPTNLTATAGDSKVTLLWDVVDGATSYTVKRSTTAGGPYTAIAGDIQGNTYVDTNVTNGTTYYYVVTAVNANGDGSNSNESSATPESENLLKITMNDSSEREYKANSSDVDKFMQWINGNGRTGDNCYKFDDVVDGSKEYLIFEKIISFKVLSSKL